MKFYNKECVFWGGCYSEIGVVPGSDLIIVLGWIWHFVFVVDIGASVVVGVAVVAFVDV